MADNKELQEAKRLLQEINTLRARLNQEPLNMTDSEAVKNIQSLRNELKGVQNSFQDIDDSATSLYDQIRAISNEFKNQPTALQKIRGSMKKITSIAEDLKMQEQGIRDLSIKQLDDLAEKLKLNKKILEDETKSLVNTQDLSKAAQEDLKSLQKYVDLVAAGKTLEASQLDTALDLLSTSQNLTEEQKASLALYLDQGNAITEVDKRIGKVKEQQKTVNKLMGVGGGIIDAADSAMSSLGMNSNMFKDAVSEAKDEMKKTAEEIASGARSGGKLSVLMAGLGPLASGFASALFDPLTIILKIADAFFKVDKAGAKFQQQTGMNADALAGANRELATSVDFLETAGELSEQIGTNAVVALGPDLVAAAAGLKNELGLSAENAGMLAVSAKLSGTSMAGLESQVQAATDEFNNTNDAAISSAQVIRDMSKSSKATQAQFAKMPGGLAKAAAAARQIGMELKDMDGVMDSLLDFQSSIEAEMEAELLTGKQLNLNKARELALANDIEGVSKELFKNSADISEYAKMNRYEQESMAKAMGMTRDQLGEMAIQRGINAGMTAEEKAQIRGVTLEESKRMDVQESLQKSLDKLVQAMTPMLEILVPIAETFGTIIGLVAKPIGMLMTWADSLKEIGGYTGAILSTISKLAIGGGILLIAKSLKDAFNPDVAGGFFKNLKENFGGIGKMASGFKDKLLGKGSDAAADITQDAQGRFRDAKGRFAKAPGGDKTKDIAGKAKDGLTDKATEQTKSVQDSTKGAEGEGPGGFLKSLGDGLASIGKQFGDVVKGALAIGIAGVALGGSFALALKMVEGVDPVTMLAFAGSIGIFGASLALVGKLGNDAIKGAIAMGIAGVALIPAAYAFNLLAGIDPTAMIALTGSLIALGIAAALLGNLSGNIIAGALALGILGVALVPAAFAFSLLEGVDVSSIVAFSIALPLLALAAAGLGFIAPFIMAGAVALGVLGLALIPAAQAFSVMAGADIAGVVDKLSLLAAIGPGLLTAGAGLIAAAGGLAIFSAALAGGSLATGITSFLTGGGLLSDLQTLVEMAGPLQIVAASLTAIAGALTGIGTALATMETEKLEEMESLISTAAFAAPAMAAVGAIGDMISGIAGSSADSGKSESNDRLIAKIDELIVAVKQGKNINMDGRKVATSLQLTASNT